MRRRRRPAEPVQSQLEIGRSSSSSNKTFSLTKTELACQSFTLATELQRPLNRLLVWLEFTCALGAPLRGRTQLGLPQSSLEVKCCSPASEAARLCPEIRLLSCSPQFTITFNFARTTRPANWRNELEKEARSLFRQVGRKLRHRLTNRPQMASKSEVTS